MARRRKKLSSTIFWFLLLLALATFIWQKSDIITASTLNRSIKLASNSVQVYFSPEGGCEQAVIRTINSAKKTIDVAIYSFTSRKIAQSLVAAKKRGVRIRIIMDKDQNRSKYSKKRYLQKYRIPIATNRGEGLMHHKFAVIDTQIVITGSYNWTVSANMYNHENLLIIKSPELAKIYEKEFTKMWRHYYH